MSLKSPEKSIEKLWDGLEKSLNFPQKSLNIFESSSFVKKKKNVLPRGMIEKNSNTQFFLVIMRVFSYDFGVPGIVHFPLFEVP